MHGLAEAQPTDLIPVVKSRQQMLRTTSNLRVCHGLRLEADGNKSVVQLVVQQQNTTFMLLHAVWSATSSTTSGCDNYPKKLSKYTEIYQKVNYQ